MRSSSGWRGVFLVLALSSFTACGGGTDEECTGSSECAAGEVCRDGVCTSGTDAGRGMDGGEDTDAGPMCEPSRQCGAICCDVGTVCGGDRCCLSEERCGGICCGADEICEAAACVLDCGDRAACEGVCCDAGDLCYVGACTTPGAPCTDTFECPAGEYCETTAGRCLPRVTTGAECEYRPMLASFELTEEWHWSGDATVMSAHDQVMMAPMVANLTDDNGDGAIDENDVPEVVFNTFTRSDYWGNGILRAISGTDGSRVWPTADPGYRTTPGAEIAIADVDPASPGPEILTCSQSFRPATFGWLIMIAADGSLLREFDGSSSGVLVPCRFEAPAVGDMDGDGTPEIVVRNLIVHADGALVTNVAVSTGRFTVLSDIDSDPDLELITPLGAFDMDGAAVWENAAAIDGYTAIADLDLDGTPELVVVSGDHTIRALDARTGALIWGPVDTNPVDPAVDPTLSGGGPPTIANFDSDPEPEIAMAGGGAYVVFEGDGTLKWYYVTRDRSSRSTGSSIFDFEGDGVAEVLYNDEQRFRVFAGPDGTVLMDRCNTSGTIREYPIVVDVDNDDHAEIVLMANNYAFDTCTEGGASATGIFAFGHPTDQWVRTRRIWNQHTYHVTNINEDATVPTHEARNWDNPRLNNFRQQVQPDGLFDAPDLVLRDLSANVLGCPLSMRLYLRVVNEGRAGARAGIPVTVYEISTGSRDRIGLVRTTRPLLPGESELLEIEFPIPAGRESDTFQFEAIINDPTDDPLSGVNECREGNNTSEILEQRCPTIS